MAFRQTFKICRFLNLCECKLCQHDALFKFYSSHPSKSNVPTRPVRQIKSACTYSQGLVQQKPNPDKLEQVSSVPVSLNSDYITVKKPFATSDEPNLHTLQPQAMPHHFATTVTTTSVQLPDEVAAPIQRKFAKSSTQNALTVPLKIPRLASPFPEPVKSMPSFVVSDEEKAKLMEEEVKMEARFHLQQQQEMMLQQKVQQNQQQIYEQQLLRQQQQQSLHQQQNLQPAQTFGQGNNYYHQNYSQEPNQGAIVNEPLRQSNYRRPLDYSQQLSVQEQQQQQIQQQQLQIQQQQQQIQQQQQQLQNQCTSTQVQNPPDPKSEGKQSRGRRRIRTRGPRFVANTRLPRTRAQERRYSSSSRIFNPISLSDVEQCEAILQRLKTLNPKVRVPKKPICVPGCQEEKEFVKNTLKFLAKYKTDQKRQMAPFPSYSEVKTFVRNPKIGEIKVESANQRANDPRSRLQFKAPAFTRGHGTRSAKEPPSEGETLCAKKRREKPCPSFKSARCKPVRPTKCDPIYDETVQCKKQEPPYPSYSECVEDPEEPEPSECKDCPWKVDMHKIYGGKKQFGRSSYSTLASKDGPSTDTQPSKQPHKNSNQGRKQFGRHNYSTLALKDDPSIDTQFKKESYRNSNQGRKQIGRTSYSTLVPKDSLPVDTQPKKKEPCKDPNKGIPPCDYEKTAQINAEKKKNRRRNPPASKKDANCASELSDNATVIEKIKGWLTFGRPELDNIKISKSSVEEDGREIYTIEIHEKEIPPDLKNIKEPLKFTPTNESTTNCLYSHAVEMTEPEVVRVENVPGFMMSDDDTSFKKPSGSGCPPPKKKKQEQEQKKKCRQMRKRKLPSCDDVKKKKGALEFPMSAAQPFSATNTLVNLPKFKKDQPTSAQEKVIAFKTHVMDLPKNSQIASKKNNEPFKLKSRYWKK